MFRVAPFVFSIVTYLYIMMHTFIFNTRIIHLYSYICIYSIFDIIQNIFAYCVIIIIIFFGYSTLRSINTIFSFFPVIRLSFELQSLVHYYLSDIYQLYKLNHYNYIIIIIVRNYITYIKDYRHISSLCMVRTI